MARRSLVVGNWKMNGFKADGLALARALAGRMRHRGDARFEMALCPPFTLIAAVGDAIANSGIALGGQDCHPKPKGAHTGDVSAPMLKDLDCRFAIVGHSERRADHGETDALVKAKAEAALAAGLTAIVCIGEREAERDAGRTLQVVKTQLLGSLPKGAAPATTVVAYEPVWAIGTGRTPTTAEIGEVHALIRSELAQALGKTTAEGIRLLYGGSVKASNAKEIFAVDGVDGGLVGGASLDVDEFWAIAEACR
ncbi:MAG: triose-phosphate isomerase [Rhodospirillales bacterium]|nr:triose-phosphate isomerase [Rhodospirillales bacterium]